MAKFSYESSRLSGYPTVDKHRPGHLKKIHGPLSASISKSSTIQPTALPPHAQLNDRLDLSITNQSVGGPPSAQTKHCSPFDRHHPPRRS
jgi:hypothetical protein